MNLASLRLAAPILGLLLLPACGKFSRLSEDEKTTSVSVGSLSNGQPRNGRSIPAMSGGVMIWGISDKQKVAIALGDENQVAEKLLKNGEWKFYAMGYAGPSQLEGAISCGSTVKKLIGADTNVDITITATGCADPFFGGTAASPVPLRLVSCNGLSNPMDGSAACDGSALGDLQSVRVRLEGSEPAALDVNAPASDFLRSACIGIGSSSYATTAGNFPIGHVGPSPMKVTVEGFTNNTCTSPATIYRFGHGLRNPPSGGPPARFFPGAGAYSASNSLYLFHGGMVAPTITSIVPSQGSWGGGTVVAINGTGFDAGASVTIGGTPCAVLTASVSTITCRTGKPNLLAPALLAVSIIRGIDGATAGGPQFSFIEEGFGNAGAEAALGNNVVLTPPLVTDAPLSSLGMRAFHSYRNVQGVSADGLTLNLRTPFTNAEFTAGDDILWHISAASSGTACESAGALPAGRYGFAKVDSIVGNQLTLRSPLPTAVDNTSLGATVRAQGSSFCAMQVVRFLSFRNLTIDTTGSTAGSFIAPPAFSMANGYGGILVVQAHDTLFIGGPSAVHLQSGGAGYAGGIGGAITGYPGDGYKGTPPGHGTSPEALPFRLAQH
ncbi:MAG: hypothetical protein EOP11_13970 [Proteobacteria bacterium]|nr:MAG: hypothetical protein EOP11_13970 [Pseudomonadota bacterium]